MNILLAIDASTSSEAALDEVAARPWPEETNVCVLRVPESTRLMEQTPLIQVATEAAQMLVKNAAERLATRGLKTAMAVVPGHPRTIILEYAEALGADFIFVGTQRMNPLTRFLMGSVAQHVVNHAPCSVGVIRARDAGRERVAGEAMKILLPTDGSDYALAAAQSVASRPWPEASEVKVLSAVDITLPAMEPWYVDQGVMERLREEAAERAQEAVIAAKKIVSNTGMEVSIVVTLSNPKAVIVDEAKDWPADLIIVGSHGRSGIDRFLLGSVSTFVAMHTHCSVEIIRNTSQLHRNQDQQSGIGKFPLSDGTKASG